jgi:Fe2+ transport system protein FeoA
MSFVLLAFSSDGVRPLSTLPVGARGIVVDVGGRTHEEAVRAERLLAYGVTAGATVTLLQRFPGIVFQCDQTELAVERAVADGVLVRPIDRDAAERPVWADRTVPDAALKGRAR